MTLQIKSIDAYDLTLSTWCPQSQKDARIVVALSIGVQGQDGLNWFEVVVTSAAAAASRGLSGSCKGRLVVPILRNGNEVERLLNEAVRQCDAGDWEKSVLKLRKVFNWEYDGYVVANDVPMTNPTES